MNHKEDDVKDHAHTLNEEDIDGDDLRIMTVPLLRSFRISFGKNLTLCISFPRYNRQDKHERKTEEYDQEPLEQFFNEVSRFHRKYLLSERVGSPMGTESQTHFLPDQIEKLSIEDNPSASRSTNQPSTS
ncbi:hypothetical protein DFA_05969 [Cavenderia fasciculata]|uniref:Uncharacterized protein n=1 Tax=Cavenderia fasciculata TaxID=261658 RepID=F4PJQ9_CACFS|nr:uncharacterized protein DFA_05969 [Cavenderia fasciculata]EGG23833.1 hypothetical protein DFA_05969 [Cavenderia fasciculata]|eukprot:XP_004361684.1 hypothetical protein DFA_05969 [Cavenderia fasciculata]